MLQEITFMASIIDFPSPRVVQLTGDIIRMLIQYGAVRDARCRTFKYVLSHLLDLMA
jgi:hypothetical protein